MVFSFILQLIFLNFISCIDFVSSVCDKPKDIIINSLTVSVVYFGFSNVHNYVIC